MWIAREKSAPKDNKRIGGGSFGPTQILRASRESAPHNAVGYLREPWPSDPGLRLRASRRVYAPAGVPRSGPERPCLHWLRRRAVGYLTPLRVAGTIRRAYHGRRGDERIRQIQAGNQDVRDSAAGNREAGRRSAVLHYLLFGRKSHNNGHSRRDSPRDFERIKKKFSGVSPGFPIH